jgi:hypothetical protein
VFGRVRRALADRSARRDAERAERAFRLRYEAAQAEHRRWAEDLERAEESIDGLRNYEDLTDETSGLPFVAKGPRG